MPYVLVVESHDEGPRPGWRRQVKGAVVPRVVEGASGVLVTGTLARRSMVARGAPPERVRVFANTIDVEEFGEQADRLASSRHELRSELGAGPDDVVVLSVARLAPEKGLDVLIHAVAEAEDPRLLLVLAGDGPERERLEDLAGVRGVRLTLAGDRDWERIVEVYVAADVFALLSEREPWAVVVNEAAACGLPLVLSDRVGAAHDLLRDGENGFLVDAGRRRRERPALSEISLRIRRMRQTRSGRARASSRATGATARASPAFSRPSERRCQTPREDRRLASPAKGHGFDPLRLSPSRLDGGTETHSWHRLPLTGSGV